ncbi:MAG: hypothetical protein KKD74_10445 [Bacteroidetes bacterium]|nr:hypothetical protein [Bacteroidota bacterium]
MLKSVRKKLDQLNEGTRLPYLTSWLIVLYIAIYSLNIGYWKQGNKIIADDVLHYYAYLPATFIYHDIELKFVSKNPSAFLDKFWPSWSPIRKNVIMTTMGMSIMYAPAFLVTHAIVMVSGGEADGFSPPYRMGLVIGGWVYLLFSILILSKLLLKFYSPLASAFSLVVVVLGTNLMHYLTAEPTMSHAYSFFLFVVFLWLTQQWHEKPDYKSAVLLGLVSGLIVLIRPTNVLTGLIFVFWNFKGWDDLQSKTRLFLQHYPKIIALLLVAIVVWIPQIAYWKFITGSYFYDSYGDNSNFFFNNPQIFNNLFSYRKGWLVYTPIMLAAFAGIGLLWKHQRGHFWPLFIFTVLNIYVVSSWWAWWYGGGFGMRAYVETYALYALGFGAFIQWVLARRKWLVKAPLLLIITLLLALNIFQTRQYFFGSIHYVGMTKEAYWHSFLHLKPYGKFYNKLTMPDMEKARKGVYVYEPLVK